MTAARGVDSSRVASEFTRDGFAVLPGLVAAGRLRRAREVADRAVAAPAGLSCERPNNTLVPLRWNSPLVQIVSESADRIAGAVGAQDLRWISGYVSVKDPHSPPLWWHQDWWAWDHPVTWRREAAQVAVLCYLSDTDAQTGALRVIPGSHAASTPLHGLLPEAHSDESTALGLQHPAMIDQPGQVTLELRGGDAVVTDYRLLHGTHAHTGTQRRDCLLLSFTPHWSQLPGDVRAHLISHPALPNADEPGPRGALASLLPSFHGPRRDLPLNRNAPSDFVTSQAPSHEPAAGSPSTGLSLFRCPAPGAGHQDDFASSLVIELRFSVGPDVAVVAERGFRDDCRLCPMRRCRGSRPQIRVKR